jgi:uncharacterized protein YdcH (DUF465 family)
MPYGKIDTLPTAIRDELNARLQDGQTGAVILPWLNALAPVKAHLKAKFNSAEITDQNLSNWRNGGYAKWQQRQAQAQRSRELVEYARGLGKDSASIFDGGAAIAGGILLETLEQLDSQTQVALIAEKPESLPKLINSLARLQQTAGQKEERNMKAKRLEMDREALELAIEKHQIATAEKLLQKATSKEVQDIINSGQPKRVKMDQLRLALFGQTAAKPIPKIAE